MPKPDATASAALSEWCRALGVEPDAVDRLLADEFSAAAAQLDAKRQSVAAQRGATSAGSSGDTGATDHAGDRVPVTVAVIDDDSGALAIGIERLLSADGAKVTAWCDSFAARQRLHTPVAASLSDALRGAQYVVVRLPKSLDRLGEFCALASILVARDATLLFGGRVKHMTLGMNEVIGRYFAHVEAHLARQKSRVLVARGPLGAPAGGSRQDGGSLADGGADAREDSSSNEYPKVARVREAGIDLAVAAHGGVFAGTRLDIGTRLLVAQFDAVLGSLAEIHEPGRSGGSRTDIGQGPETEPAPDTARPRLLDLGCGSGILATLLAQRAPAATVIATDDSYLAVASTRETARRAGVLANAEAAGVWPLWDDAATSVQRQSIDLIVCNPPFHQGAAVDTSPALAMFEAAGRLLRPGGQLWTVFNRHLGYVPALRRLVGPTRVVAAAPKFVITQTTRRSTPRP